MTLTRRRFLETGAAWAAAALAGCGPGEPATLPQPLVGDPLETLRVRGYRGLAELPWFERDAAGELRLTVDLPPGVDFHAHLGFFYFLAPAIDYNAAAAPTQYGFDCDADPHCVLDLDVYMNHFTTEKMQGELTSGFLRSFLLGSAAGRTHTLPNLRQEMDRNGIERAVLLPVRPGFPFRDDLTDPWLEAVAQSGSPERFVVFGAVHPAEASAAAELDALADRGLRGVKLHPTMQRVAPDDPRAMALYEVCRDRNLIVFFHAGRAGVEPEFMQPYALMERYEAPVAEFPDVDFVFGHAGARDFEAALPVARGRRNVWMDAHGQGVRDIGRLVDAVGPERVLFGTDWPLFPQAASLAKLLIATRADAALRDRIFAENARELLAA
ncbi:MAG: amidohydrolase family protein [Myxococcota bacterium]|nr:amidohydrolase family protein [Myxococcota bacterium]